MTRGPNRYGPQYIVRAREREQWTTQTIKGPRRVYRMTPWLSVGYFLTKAEAFAEIDLRKRKNSLEECAVFREGKRVHR